jgi:hypothetical protein
MVTSPVPRVDRAMVTSPVLKAVLAMVTSPALKERKLRKRNPIPDSD